MEGHCRVVCLSGGPLLNDTIESAKQACTSLYPSTLYSMYLHHREERLISPSYPLLVMIDIIVQRCVPPLQWLLSMSAVHLKPGPKESRADGGAPTAVGRHG